MGQQCLLGFGIKSNNIAFQFFVCNLTEEVCQRHDILLTVTQRRDVYLEVMQAVQQVLSGTLLIYCLFQIFVGGGDDTDIEILIRFIT